MSPASGRRRILVPTRPSTGQRSPVGHTHALDEFGPIAEAVEHPRNGASEEGRILDA